MIVPDRHGSGTNALLLTPPDAIAPSFGPGSFARHAALGAAAGAVVRVAHAPSLELDVDTPGDLEALRGALRGLPDAAPRTRALLERMAPRVRRVTRAARSSPSRCRGCRRSAPGDDLAALLAQAAARLPDAGLRADRRPGVAHKAVAKAEGRVVALADVTPGARARALAASTARTRASSS